MGAYASAPIDLTRVQRGGGAFWRGAVAEMQGWCVARARRALPGPRATKGAKGARRRRARPSVENARDAKSLWMDLWMDRRRRGPPGRRVSHEDAHFMSDGDWTVFGVLDGHCGASCRARV
jgi:hypothetical protein